MRLPDRVTGLFLVGLGAAAAYGGWQLPPVPGQPVGPNVFPLVIGTGSDSRDSARVRLPKWSTCRTGSTRARDGRWACR